MSIPWSSLSDAILNPNNRYQEMSRIMINEYWYVPLLSHSGGVSARLSLPPLKESSKESSSTKDLRKVLQQRI